MQVFDGVWQSARLDLDLARVRVYGEGSRYDGDDLQIIRITHTFDMTCSFAQFVCVYNMWGTLDHVGVCVFGYRPDDMPQCVHVQRRPDKMRARDGVGIHGDAMLQQTRHGGVRVEHC